MAKKAYFGVGGKARRIKKGYIGISGKARRIKKGYIGVNGIARLCFWGKGDLVYRGTSVNGKNIELSGERAHLAATTIGNHALFGGGGNGWNHANLDSVDAFNSSLSKSTPAQLSTPRGKLVAVSDGNLALFGGGFSSVSHESSDEVDAYDVSLSHSTASAPLSAKRNSLAATCIGDYFLFGGGDIPGQMSHPHQEFCSPTDVVDSYNKSLEKNLNVQPLNVASCYLGAATIGNHAIFCGGISNTDSDAKLVTAYNTSLGINGNISTNFPTLYRNYSQCLATTVGDYAVFASGSSYGCLISYSKSLTLYTTESRDIVFPMYEGTVTSIDGYALFSGGVDPTTSGHNYTNRTFTVDDSLTWGEIEPMYEHVWNHAAAVIGNYALLGGGLHEPLDDPYLNNSASSAVHVYEVVY